MKKRQRIKLRQSKRDIHSETVRSSSKRQKKSHKDLIRRPCKKAYKTVSEVLKTGHKVFDTYYGKGLVKAISKTRWTIYMYRFKTHWKYDKPHVNNFIRLQSHPESKFFKKHP